MEKLESNLMLFLQRCGYRNNRRGGRGRRGRRGNSGQRGGENSSSPGGYEDRACYGCGRKDHLIKSCPNNVHNFCSTDCYVQLVDNADCQVCMESTEQEQPRI